VNAHPCKEGSRAWRDAPRRGMSYSARQKIAKGITRVIARSVVCEGISYKIFHTTKILGETGKEEKMDLKNGFYYYKSIL
jgi:hypothetical protein